ncbi:MAG TPA: PilZ domain-containing protein [Kofleriaceae bacterium]|jgi:hypothetical protein|nr:PilZ domain-containing protein [Kofleriaceae bacterium]
MGEPKTPERRRHFRGKARAGRRVRVRYRVQGTPAWTAAETRNVGIGGAFILGGALAPGTEIDVQIDLPDRPAPLALTAEVRWRADGRADDPAGIGVMFHDVDIDILLELNGFLASLTGTEPEGVPALIETDPAGPSNGAGD